MLLMHAAKQQACRQIEALLSAPFDDGVFQAKNLLFFDHAMDHDSDAAYRAYQQVARVYAKVLDHDPQESLDDAVKRVCFEIRDDLLAGEVSLGSQVGASMEEAKVRFDRGMTNRRNQLRDEGVLMSGMEAHMEARVTMAVMIAEALVCKSDRYARRLPEIIDRIKTSLPEILQGSKSLTLGKVMFDDPEDITALIDDSDFTVRVGMRACQLQYADLETPVRAARAEDAIRRDLEAGVVSQ